MKIVQKVTSLTTDIMQRNQIARVEGLSRVVLGRSMLKIVDGLSLWIWDFNRVICNVDMWTDGIVRTALKIREGISNELKRQNEWENMEVK